MLSYFFSKITDPLNQKENINNTEYLRQLTGLKEKLEKSLEQILIDIRENQIVIQNNQDAIKLIDFEKNEKSNTLSDRIREQKSMSTFQTHADKYISAKFGSAFDDIISKLKGEIESLNNFRKQKYTRLKEAFNTYYKLDSTRRNVINQLKSIDNKIKDTTKKQLSKLQKNERNLNDTKKKLQNRIKDDFKTHHYPRILKIPREYMDMTFKNLKDVFEHIEAVKETAFHNNAFVDAAHIIPLIPYKFEIALLLESGCDKKSQIISIRFRKPMGPVEGCLQLIIKSWDQKVITIDRVDIPKCNSDIKTHDDPIVHCYIILALLLCSYLGAKKIEIKDRDYYTKNGDSYRQSKLISNKDSYSGKLFSHDLSYFAPYGFKDILFNEEIPLINDNKSTDAKYDAHVLFDAENPKSRFYLMTRYPPEYNVEYLQNVSVEGLNNFDDLRNRLYICNTERFKDMCKDSIFQVLAQTKSVQIPTNSNKTDSNKVSFGKNRRKPRSQRARARSQPRPTRKHKRYNLRPRPKCAYVYKF